MLQHIDRGIAWAIGHWRRVIVMIIALVIVLGVIGVLRDQTSSLSPPAIISPELLVGIDHLVPGDAMNHVSPQIMPVQVFSWAYELKNNNGEDVVVFGAPAILWMSGVTTRFGTLTGEFTIQWHNMSGLGIWMHTKAGWSVIVVWHPEQDVSHWLEGLRTFLLAHS